RGRSGDTSRYLPFVSTQWAAVSTRSGAIATPVHRLCSPMISTTWRAIASSAGGAPPTMAAAGARTSARQAQAKGATGIQLRRRIERLIGREAEARQASGPPCPANRLPPSREQLRILPQRGRLLKRRSGCCGALGRAQPHCLGLYRGSRSFF